jgi:hypothetical protein
MDVSVALRRVENLLRDTLQNVLSRSIGDEWTSKCGVAPDRIDKWKERAAEELRRKGQRDPRLIYYADFYDLKTVIRKSWQSGLSEIFGDLKELEALLKILEELRNPEAHRREFLPFEVQLASGIAGRISSQVTRYYSQMETSESYYPRFEFAQDNIGNSYSIGQGKFIASTAVLRPGCELEFKLVASDPLGEMVEYAMYPNAMSVIAGALSGALQWNTTGEFRFEVKEEYVGRDFSFLAAARSRRVFHAEDALVFGAIDDKLFFRYEVLPPLRG